MVSFQKKSRDSKIGKGYLPLPYTEISTIKSLSLNSNFSLSLHPILILLNISMMIRIKTGEQPAETSVWIIPAFLIFPYKISPALCLSQQKYTKPNSQLVKVKLAGLIV